jgi:Pirin
VIERRPFQSLSGHRCDWLQAKYHFSPLQPRSGWGALRIWNDDEIEPNSGFPPHSHINMEIITYVRDGAVSHRDSLGNGGQDNSFVGITAMPQPDGTIKAVEVHVFAEPLRGIGEGHYPWDLMPNSSMTNAAVTQQVKKAEGNTLMLKYKDGEKTIVVPTDATVVNLIPGDQADLKPGAKIFIPRWEKRADGTWEATVALVGRDGITPPM